MYFFIFIIFETQKNSASRKNIYILNVARVRCNKKSTRMYYTRKKYNVISQQKYKFHHLFITHTKIVVEFTFTGLILGDFKGEVKRFVESFGLARQFLFILR